MSSHLASSSLPVWLPPVLAGLVGLALGSFFTVVIDRWPAGHSLVRPRSACGGCERTLGWAELVPVVSWLCLRGRCRRCGTRIDVRYPLIELASAGLAAAAVASFGPSWRGLAAAALLVALVPVVVIDLQHKLIPDVIVLPAAGLGLVAAIASDPSRWWVYALAAGGAAVGLGTISLLYPKGMGMGDAKLALLLGAVLGASVIPALAVAFVVGAVIGIALLARHGAAGRKLAVPFGPFLSIGGVVGLFWGPAMVSWYLERMV
jgi:leader peptidase (prepilin peptidase)/N-methyltransferase